MTQNTFYVVWNPSHGSPSYRHSTYSNARSEAERLAKIASEQEFYVLQAISKSRCISATTEKLHNPYEKGSEEIPF